MKIASKFAVILATAAMTVGLAGSPANADSSWDSLPTVNLPADSSWDIP